MVAMRSLKSQARSNMPLLLLILLGARALAYGSETHEVNASRIVPGNLSSASCIVYVDDDAGENGDGTTWETAYRYLKDALELVTPDCEVRVAGGTYKPDQSEFGYATPLNRLHSFRLKDRTTVRGGYAGFAQPENPDFNDANIFESLLLGDLLGDDQPGFVARQDNSYRIVRAESVSSSTLLEGFTIKAGNSNSGGAGLDSNQSDLTVACCKFMDNQAPAGGGARFVGGNPRLFGCFFGENQATGSWTGGGAIAFSGGSPMLTGCQFANNRATDSYGVGGAIANWAQVLQLSTCSFANNHAPFAGEAMYNISTEVVIQDSVFERNGHVGSSSIAIWNSDASVLIERSIFTKNLSGVIRTQVGDTTIRDSLFLRNEAYDGPAVNNGGLATTTLFNSLLVQNHASRDGGAVYATDGQVLLSSCTVADNEAGRYGGGLSVLTDDAPTIIQNTIIWGNRDSRGSAADSQVFPLDSEIELNYTILQGLDWPMGQGNLSADPLFRPGPFSCYYLSAVAAGSVQDSPALDVGSDSAANVGLAFMTTRMDELADDGVIDLGFHAPLTGRAYLTGDYDRDGDLDIQDFAAFLLCFDPHSVDPVAPCCRVFHTDEAKGNVGLHDYGPFANSLAGPH